MAKVFLHIGVNKTGTTAIQSFFSAHRDRLLDQGLLYPCAGSDGSAHHDLAHRLGFVTTGHHRGVGLDAIADLREALEREIACASPAAVLLSSEDFVRPAPLGPVRDFLEPHDVRIVVYLRRHDTWWPALYSQALKSTSKPPWRAGIDAYMRLRQRRPSSLFSYRALLERWASVFGGTNIVVRPYERQQYAPDIVIDMLRTIAHDLGRRVDDFPFLDRISSPRRNASFSPSALQLMEIFQRAELPPEVRERLLRHARSGSAVEPKQSTLSPGRRLELIEENAADYAYIAREYMGREDGRLFYDPLPDPDEPWEPPKPLAPGQIVEETVKALLGEADLAS